MAGPVGRVCLRDIKLYGLLVAVYPVFVRALPDISEASSNLAALSVNGPVPSDKTAKEDSAITALRNQIKGLSLAFKTAEGLSLELSDELHEEALSYLQVILHCFEDLVHDNGIESGSTPNPTSSELPKLEWVREHSDEAQRLVSYGTQRSQHTLIRAAAKVFSGFVERLYSSTRDASKEGSFYPAQQDNQTILPRLDDALCLAEKVRQLFDVLQTSSCESRMGHNGYLRLPDDLNKTTLDMLLSVCGEDDLWQQVYFRLQDKPTNVGKAARSMCSEMIHTLRIRKRMEMALYATSTGWHLRTVPSSKKPAAFTRPNKSLRAALDDEHQNAATQDAATPKQTSGKLRRLAKSKLGVRIAATLFCLFASPLFQLHDWGMACFHILQSDAAITDDDPTPPSYLSFCLDGPQSPPIGQQIQTETVDNMTSVLAERHIRAADGNHLLLALTVSLLELESGGKIVLSPADFDKELNAESLYFAAMRIHEERKHDLEAATYDAIQSCLDIYADSVDVNEKGYHARIQTALFYEVFTPLVCRHDRLWKAMSQSVPIDLPVAGSDNSRQAPSSETYRSRDPPQQMSPIKEYDETARPSVSKQVQDSSVWLKKVDTVNGSVGRVSKVHSTGLVSKVHSTDRDVRVAILDTGCNLKAMCIKNLDLNVLQLKKRWKDWVNGATEPIDEDEGNHGTATAALLLRVAKHADVYIARVTKDTNGLSSAQESIAAAITHAVHVWDVDIVSMSFGFHGSDVTNIQKAIDEATTARAGVGGGILFFAAANNKGLNEKEMFPARHRDVIAIRGTDHMGRFLQEYNCDPWANKENECRFGTLASEVPYDCVDATCWKSGCWMSGCSVATPILAGLVATIIQYMEYRGKDIDKDGNLRKGIRKREGIIQVMKLLTDRPHVERYLTPLSFFEKPDHSRIALVRMALDALP